MSISTTKGDDGRTMLTGGVRVSKSDDRVEAYGTIDELISSIGFARSICEDREVNAQLRKIQEELFLVCSAISTAEDKDAPDVPVSLVARLTEEVHRLESEDETLSDWSVAGEHAVSAALDVARTVCRRAERAIVRVVESGVVIQPTVLAYLNRLSDLLWIHGRSMERKAGVDASLRRRPGKRWSRAW